MKDDKKLLQLLQRTSEAEEQHVHGIEHGVPMAFVDLGTFNTPEKIDVIEAEPVVVVPRECELAYVPGPEDLQ